MVQRQLLLQRLLGRVMPDKVFKYGEDMAAVVHNSFKQLTELRFALRFAVPFGQDGRGDFDVPAQFFGGVSAQEKPVEESSLPLGKLELLKRIVQRIGCRSHTRKMQFTDFQASVKTGFCERETGNQPRPRR